MSSWPWEGARWWKVDLHTHTPASADYGKGPDQKTLKARTPREWLLDYMRAGIDCVAITDHNSGAWIDDLRQALDELSQEPPPDYRRIYLLPGVEISVHGGVHLLAVLESEKTTSDVDSLLGAVGFTGTKGTSNTPTSEPFAKVVAAIEEAGGIAIPAHADGENGLFKLTGSTREQALACEGVFAIEIVDADAPLLSTQGPVPRTEVLGSDSHHPCGNSDQRFPGSHFTWVKMGAPSLEGLRLALLDGSLSVRRSDAESGDPNQHGPLLLESIEVTRARYMGRAGSFTLRLNPWLNTIVGGRGTGKSSLVEFLRLALRRQDELPQALVPEFEKYGEVYERREDIGLLTKDAKLTVHYHKNGSTFRVQWSPVGDVAPIQEKVAGDWRATQGDVAQRFPVRLYSQKQVLQLAMEPLALLKVIDEAPEVHHHQWHNRWEEEGNRYLALQAQAREMETALQEESRLQGELEDVRRKLEVFEGAGHTDVLTSFQRRRRQQRAVERWEEGWSHIGEGLRKLASEAVPDTLDESAWDPESGEEDIHEIVAKTQERFGRIRGSLEDLASQVDDIGVEWQQSRDLSTWKRLVDEAMRAYTSLQRRLEEEGAGDPSAYGALVQRRQAIEQRLRTLESNKKEVASLRRQAAERLEDLAKIRRELTRTRRTFLEGVLKNNRYVRIQVRPYGAWYSAESQLRGILEGGGFERSLAWSLAVGRPTVSAPEASRKNLSATRSVR